jgi:hypothetical protein
MDLALKNSAAERRSCLGRFGARQGGRLVPSGLIALAAAGAAWAQTPDTDSPKSGGIPTLSASTEKSAPEAWWTGPIIASSGGTVPEGHVLFEPYLFDARSGAGDYMGSLTYILYGVTDRLTLGLIPTFGAAHSKGGGARPAPAVNDLTLTVQYRLHRADIGDAVPTFSLVVQRVLPLGRYDRLRAGSDRGIGSGSHATLLGLYAQWSNLLGDRILRTRVNLTGTFADRTTVRGASVFGTPTGFLGHGHHGDSMFLDVSFEYSLTRNWVLASDLFHSWSGRGHVSGDVEGQGRYSAGLPSARSFGVAPAVEYSWSASRGVLVGIRRIMPGRNRWSSWTPVIAFNAYL